MIKNQFLKELVISDTQKKDSPANNKKDVRKIQSWLNLFARLNTTSGTATGMDGDFGPATEKAVQNFQKAKGLTQTGVVDAALFSKLCQPMANAFETPVTGTKLRELILKVAQLHVENSPFEQVIDGQSNSGPWVRSYMNGADGEDQLWCMGFVQTIIDQAASQLGKDFRTLMPVTGSCDTVGTTGINKGLLTRFTEVRRNPAVVKPGDIFLFQSKPFDWIHTGIILAVKNGLFETAEGNTNSGGSSNGNAAVKRIRNFQQSKLDVFSIEPLV